MHLDVSLDRYPELEEGLTDIFCMKFSLIDLARKLENDLIIWES